MIVYRIESHDPISGYHYGREIFGTIDAAKNWLSNFLEELKESGLPISLDESDTAYTIAFSIGGMFYQYRVVSVYTIG